MKNIAEPVRAYAVCPPGASPRRRRSRLPYTAAAGVPGLAIAGLVAWAVHSGADRELLQRGAASKAVDVASLAAPARLAGRQSGGGAAVQKPVGRRRPGFLQ